MLLKCLKLKKKFSIFIRNYPPHTNTAAALRVVGKLSYLQQWPCPPSPHSFQEYSALQTLRISSVVPLPPPNAGSFPPSSCGFPQIVELCRMSSLYHISCHRILSLQICLNVIPTQILSNGNISELLLSSLCVHLYSLY